MLKQWVQKLLTDLARAVIRRHQPVIIGITGSVGKTSARDAIFAVVETSFTARKPYKNLNNEFGLPLSILGEDSPGRNPLAWLLVFTKGLIAWLFGPFPKVLVLEMGIDRPGDMDYLLSIAKPDISVVTSIGLSHYEFFKTMDVVAREKGKIVEVLPSEATAILNADNDQTSALVNRTKAKVLKYGLRQPADIKVEIKQENLIEPASTTLNFTIGEKNFEVVVPVVGEAHISALTSAVAVGVALNIHHDAIKQGLQNYRPVPGRLNVLSGIKGSVLIDDTYNSAPESARVALELLSRHPAKNKIAVLGDMLELGDESESAHLSLGQLVAELKLTRLMSYGASAKLIADGAIGKGMDASDVEVFSDQEALAKQLLGLLNSDTAVLIKGSQGVRMEKITKELLAKPMTASTVLCRQYGKWLDS